MNDDAWIAEHKGDYIDTVAEIWDCGDDECRCSRALIVERYANAKAPGWVVRIAVWEGEFHTDGEPGAEEELAAKRAELRAADPELEARIMWPAWTASPAAEQSGEQP